MRTSFSICEKNYMNLFFIGFTKYHFLLSNNSGGKNREIDNLSSLLLTLFFAFLIVYQTGEDFSLVDDSIIENNFQSSSMIE